MTTNNKRTKRQSILNEEQTKEMFNYLKKEKGSHGKLADELGVTRTSITGWKNKGKFPKYCNPVLKLDRIKKGL